MIQQTLAFTGDNGIPTECEILINQNILVASDRGIGVSVTNACETIATEAVRRFGLDPGAWSSSNTIQPTAQTVATGSPSVARA